MIFSAPVVEGDMADPAPLLAPAKLWIATKGAETLTTDCKSGKEAAVAGVEAADCEVSLTDEVNVAAGSGCCKFADTDSVAVLGWDCAGSGV